MSSIEQNTISRTDWWAKKRYKYNISLVVSFFLAFVVYNIVGATLIAPYDMQFEITLFTLIPMLLGFLLAVGIANICYSLGLIVDIIINPNDIRSKSLTLYRVGYWFSICLPFSIPLLLVMEYYIKYT